MERKKMSSEFRGKPIEQVEFSRNKLPDHPLSGLLQKKLNQFERYRNLKRDVAEDLYQEAAIFLLENYPLEEEDYSTVSKEEVNEVLRKFERHIRRFAKNLGMSPSHLKREKKLVSKDPESDSDIESWHPAFADEFWGVHMEKKAATKNIKIVKDIILNSGHPQAEDQWKAFESFALGARISEIAGELDTTVPKAKKILDDAKILIELHKDQLIEPEEERKVA